MPGTTLVSKAEEMNKKVPPREKPSIAQVHRPWGSFKQYVYNSLTTVSLMTVQPGQRLSLQSHANRSELWIVIDSGACIEVGDKVLYPEAGEEVWIPAGTPHRLSGLTAPARVLEVAFGDWKQEDITRYDDDYNRPAQGE